MTEITLQALLGCVEKVAVRAGKEIMAIHSQDFTVEQKADNSPVTEADKAANDIIVAGLEALPVSFPILTEEAVEAFSGPDAEGCYWLVDPLDGTKEFIQRNGEFTVNIALIQQGRPVLGVVYAPALDVTYMGGKGIGAFKVEGKGPRQPIQVAKHQSGSVWRVLGSRSHASQKVLEWLKPLGEYELVPMGSSLKICLVAEGAADLYPRFGKTSLWDTAAAHAVVNAAGGAIETLQGKVLDYSNTAKTLNPEFVVYGGSRP
ncbi:3'(2'),5'-bisphosphate nucleotidase CysQ [Marinobacterium sp. AK62]|uniref:3'(2'),5'-bisphosphate nucleotidase CysQ n=1 Tax=Marinobacterium alkalitolerans TaxID=1542925 RepID=A0ABS3Z8R4_9GAMM|nr:3'(2'),5'-bisphosphate nucleotidase CysQ [Marinobacterium alkalitolerans]MBP0048102.1 3'(2'),5'-bisphosphate nucleotidase CysQ [Marinobacterium alkalitolerans]